MCCSNILPLTTKEIKKIRRYIKKHRIKPVSNLGGLDCPFCDYSKQDKCLIYEVRPEICRKFFCKGEMRKRLDGIKNMRPVSMRDVLWKS